MDASRSHCRRVIVELARHTRPVRLAGRDRAARELQAGERVEVAASAAHVRSSQPELESDSNVCDTGGGQAHGLRHFLVFDFDFLPRI